MTKEKSLHYHINPFRMFAPSDEKRHKHAVDLPMDVLLAIVRERLSYANTGTDLDALTQQIGCEIERAMGIFPNTTLVSAVGEYIAKAHAKKRGQDVTSHDKDERCPVATVAPYEPWEYVVRSFDRRGHGSHDAELTGALDKEGAQEWELVAFDFDRNKAIFKRRKKQ